MGEREALLRAVCENPDDDLPRLVFADWLEEHGEPERAEFIRVQCELAKLPDTNSPRRSVLAKRESELLEAYKWDWLTRVWGENVQPAPLRRGFLCPILSVKRFVRRGKKLFLTEPVTEVTIDLDGIEDGPLLRQFVDLPDLMRVTEIGASQRWTSNLGPSGFARLIHSPHLRRVRSLYIGEDPIGVEGVRALLAAPCVISLKVLKLFRSLAQQGEEACDPDEAVELLANAPELDQLEELALWDEFTDRGARALMSSCHLPSLKMLIFESFNRIHSDWLDRLQTRFPEVHC